MSGERAPTFLHRLFARGAGPWTARWASEPFAGWDGGAGEDAGKGENLAKIAATASGPELRHILRHGDETAIMAALGNPAVTHEDILDLAKSPKATPNVLGAIGRRKEWSGDPDLATALCLNPKTPYFASRFLLSHLPSSELREVAQSGQVPPALSKDAMELLDKKRTRRQSR